MKTPKYIISRCRSLTDDSLVGPAHASADGGTTACGQQINELWYVTHTNYDTTGLVTCKKCLKELTKHEGE